MSKNKQEAVKVAARIRFAKLDQPEVFRGKKPQYSVVFLWDITNEAEKAEALKVKGAIERLAASRWPDAAERRDALTSKPRLRAGDADHKFFGPNIRFLQACNVPGKDAPILMVDQRRNLCASSAFYDGCYVNAMLELYTWDNPNGRGISARVTHLQFKRDGEPFAGKGEVAPADQVFDIEEGANTGADDDIPF